MIKLFLTVLFFLQFGFASFSQTAKPDSIIAVKSDSINVIKDSAAFKLINLERKIIQHHPYFNFYKPPVYPAYTRKINPPGKEIYFYIIASLLIIFAGLKTGFEKYFSDLMHLFFGRSLKQRQIKQQLVQNSLPSLLFNLLFVFTAGFYVALAINTFVAIVPFPFLELFAYSTIAIGCFYLIKFFVLNFLGWTFRVSTLTDNYIFITFLVNKIIMLVLLPLLIIIALSNNQISTIGWTLSWILICGLIVYRYASAIGLIRQQNSISFFHFLLYLCAFEILPTLMIYQGIISFLK